MSLARSLSVNVVAEGVENEDQFNVLYAKGCQYFQGWYFGRPSKTIE
jgi:EAL domain-containing protein (putative c-di-GMP-specific phosphodiesterase class I)